MTSSSSWYVCTAAKSKHSCVITCFIGPLQRGSLNLWSKSYLHAADPCRSLLMFYRVNNAICLWKVLYKSRLSKAKLSSDDGVTIDLIASDLIVSDRRLTKTWILRSCWTYLQVGPLWQGKMRWDLQRWANTSEQDCSRLFLNEERLLEWCWAHLE